MALIRLKRLQGYMQPKSKKSNTEIRDIDFYFNRSFSCTLSSFKRKRLFNST